MFPDRLTKLRIEHKKTHQEMADLLGITRPAYTAYENGKRRPDYDTLIKLANYFDETVDYLLGNTDNRKISYQRASDHNKDGLGVAEQTASYEEKSERDLLLEELEQYGNLAFEGGGEDLDDDELREIVQAMRDAAKTAARNMYNVISKFKK